MQFHANRFRNMGSKAEILSRPSVRYDCHIADFHETHVISTTGCREAPYRFSWTSSNGLVGTNRSQTQGRGMWSLHKGFFLFHIERLETTTWPILHTKTVYWCYKNLMKQRGKKRKGTWLKAGLWQRQLAVSECFLPPPPPLPTPLLLHEFTIPKVFLK